MVILIENSSVDEKRFPYLREWDQKVRENYNIYQKLIDSQTYQLQRIQRYLFSYQYPQKYDSDLITLDLLKKKQRVGQVTQDQLKLYESINPCIRSQFTRTFGSSFQLPKLGLAVGAALFTFGSLFNHSIPSRFIYFTLPIVTSYFWNIRTPGTQVRSSQFLDWVFQYRKARVFAEKHCEQFNNSQTKKYLKDGNLAQLGDQLVKLAA